MVIQRLFLENFRSFGRAELPLSARVTMVIGRNEAGKSSLVDALAWTLLGRCRGTDARGSGSDTLIRTGQTFMRARLQVAEADDLTRVERTHNAKTSAVLLNDAATRKEEQSGQLYQRIGVTPAVIEACLNTEAFLALHHADAKNLLLDVLNVRVAVDGHLLTLGQVEALYTQACEERRTLKARLQKLTVPPAPDQEGPDVAALEAKLATLREQETQARLGVAEASGRDQELRQQLAHVEAAIARTESALAATATAKGLDGATVSIADAVADLEAALARAALSEDEDAVVQQQRLALVDAQGRLRLLQDTVTALEAHSPDRGCVLNAAIPCKTPARAFTGQVQALQQELETLRVAQDAATKTIEKGRLREAERKRLSALVQPLLERQTARERQAEDLRALKATRERLQVEREQLPPANSDASTEVQALRDRIANGERVIREARELAQQAHRYEESKARHEAASRALHEIETRCEHLGPKGLRADALQAAIGAFEARINQALDRFGYRLRIIAEPWLVLVNDLPAELHSTSARLRIGVALQLALAEVTGFGFVAIDQVDLLDGRNRALFAELLDLASERVQILAAATRDDDVTPAPIEGWTFLRVREVEGVSRIEYVHAMEHVAEAVPS